MSRCGAGAREVAQRDAFHPTSSSTPPPRTAGRAACHIFWSLRGLLSEIVAPVYDRPNSAPTVGVGGGVGVGAFDPTSSSKPPAGGGRPPRNSVKAVVCRPHRAGASRPPSGSCICASVFFGETRKESNGERAAHLAIFSCSTGQNLSVLRAGRGSHRLQGCRYGHVRCSGLNLGGQCLSTHP